MKCTGQIILAVSLTVFAIYLLTERESHGVIVYDCRLAEISPDIPIDVKDQCRKLQMQQHQEQNLERTNDAKYTT
jgi:hypothetical protein